MKAKVDFKILKDKLSANAALREIGMTPEYARDFISKLKDDIERAVQRNCELFGSDDFHKGTFCIQMASFVLHQIADEIEADFLSVISAKTGESPEALKAEMERRRKAA